MAGFLYFLSGTRRPMTAEAVRELGLGHILDGDGATSYREAQGNTPSGAPGVTFAAASRHDRDVALAPGKQTWRRLPKTIGGGNVWLGYWDDAKPTPSDLARAKQLPGPTVELADGHRWMVPLVLSLDLQAERYETALPTRWDFDDDGNWVRGAVGDEYAALWDAATPFADERFEMAAGREVARVEMDEQRLLACVTTLLQANYAVGQAELVMLGALADDQSTALVPLLACDFFELVQRAEAQKKSESQPVTSGGDTCDGEAA